MGHLYHSYVSHNQRVTQNVKESHVIHVLCRRCPEFSDQVWGSKEPMELTNTCASWRKQRASKESQWPKVGWFPSIFSWDESTHLCDTLGRYMYPLVI